MGLKTFNGAGHNVTYDGLNSDADCEGVARTDPVTEGAAEDGSWDVFRLSVQA